MDVANIGGASELQLINDFSAFELEDNGLKFTKSVDIGHEVVYFIDDERVERPLAYRDEPTWAIGPHGEIVMKAHFPVPNVEAYIEGRHNVAFLVGRFYSVDEQEKDVYRASREKKTLPPPRPSEETIRLGTPDMKEAMEAFLAATPGFEEEADDFDPSAPISAPYLFWYHNRSPKAFENLSEVHEKHMRALTNWIDQNYGELYTRVDEQLSQSVVTPQTIEFLLKRGDAIVKNSKPGHDDGVVTGLIANGYPSRIVARDEPEDAASPWAKRSKPGKFRRTWKWSTPVWSYKYDGSFFRDERYMEFEIEADTAEERVPIKSLSAYPLRFATEDTRELLHRRGNIFWACRNQRLVAYEDTRRIYGVSSC